MRYLSLFAHGELVEVALWDGPWPPEAELLRCVGRTTGIVTITSRSTLREQRVEEDTLRRVATVQEFALTVCTADAATYNASV